MEKSSIYICTKKRFTHMCKILINVLKSLNIHSICICDKNTGYMYNFCEYYDDIFCKKLFNACEKGHNKINICSSIVRQKIYIVNVSVMFIFN